MNALTLRQLRYALALARAGHFGHAAELCAVTQPALSMQIRELEGALGVAIFDRSARRVRLTGFGTEFVARAAEILRAVDDLGDLARAADARLAGRVRLGVIPTVAPYLLPRLVAGLQRSHPDLELHLRESLTQRLLEELREGRIDAAILALPVPEQGLSEVVLASEAFVLVRPASEADQPVPDREALREMRLLLLEEGHCFRDQAISFCGGAAGRPRELLDASALGTLVQMVAAGIGVTLLPEMALEVETRAAAVSLARFPDPAPRRRIGMVWRAASPLAPHLRTLAGIAGAALAPGGDDDQRSS